MADHEPALFDLEPAGEQAPPWSGEGGGISAGQPAEQLDLQADDTAWASCRHCQTLTTAAGITNRGHADPTSGTCARMLAWEAAS